MASDNLDSKGFTFKGDSNLVENISATISRSADYYDMNHKNRGTAIILNHKTFKPILKMGTRDGTDKDCAHLKELFVNLGFKVKVYNDLPYKTIKEKLDKVSKEDHRDDDCLVCVVLTHGDEGTLYCHDTQYKTSDLWTPFLAHNCPSLTGKPKLFFLQACQGYELDDGVPVMMTDSAHQIRFPSHADFLISYSTVPGYYSWRNTSNGSWFIQALCHVLSKHYETTDLLSMMTMVNRVVALDFESSHNDPKMHEKKQVPCITSMLTRKVFFGKQSS